MFVDKHLPLLASENDTSTLQTWLTDIVCYIFVILGVTGNVLGLFVFSSSRRTRQISSTYACLATCSSITNLLCLIRYASILHFTTRRVVQKLVAQTWWGCKMYEFSFSFRVTASWITLFWMFERFMCASNRFRAIFQRWCSCKLNFIVPIITIILVLGCVIGPPLYMYQPRTVLDRNNTGHPIRNITHCCIDPNVSIRWQKYFQETGLGGNHFTVRCIFSELFPTGAVILFNCYIIYHVARAHRRLHKKCGHHPCKTQSRTTSWMNAVLILHSILFLSSLLSHIAGHFIVVEAHEAWWVLLSVLTNCSLNFYIYCLSGKAFRNEIRRILQQLKIQCSNQSQIRQRQSNQNERFLHEMTDFRPIVRL